MPRTRHLAALTLSLACLAACANPANTGQKAPSASASGVSGPTTGKPGTTPPATPGPNATPASPASAPLPTVAVAASITGRVVAPALLVASGGLNLIGNNGNTLIGMDGGSMVAAGAGNMVAAGAGNMVAAGAGNMVAAGAGNMVAAGAGNYALAQASPTPSADAVPRPVARARVFLTIGDAPLPIPAVETDDDGNYRFPAVPAGLTYQVVVSIITPAGKTGRLASLVKAEATGAVADVSPVTTMICAAVVGTKTKLGEVDPAAFRQAADALTQAVATKDPVKEGIDLTRPDLLAGKVETLLESVDTAKQAITALRATIEQNATDATAATQLVTGLKSTGCPAPAVVLGVAGFEKPPVDMPKTPSALAAGPDGKLYLADPETGNIVVYKGTERVTTFGAEGRVTGLASVALAVGPDDAVYVADAESGQVARKPGSGTWEALAPKDFFIEPTAIAIRGADVYVADAGRHRVYKLDPKGGTPTVFAGSKAGFVDGRGEAARFNRPMGLAFVGDDLFVADAGNRRIRRIRPLEGGAAEVRSIAGGGPGNADGQGAAARFGYPAAIVAGEAGELWVADAGNRTVRSMKNDVVATALASGCRLEANGLSYAGGLAFHDGSLYILDDDRVSRWTLKAAAATPTPSATPTASASPGASPTPSGTPGPSATPSASATPGPTVSPTPSQLP